MSVQAEIETAITVLIEGAILEIQTSTGPRTPPQVEGSVRFAAVRFVAGSGERLEFAQTAWTETYKLTLSWDAALDRGDVLDEWAAFASALLLDPLLGAAVEGWTDSYLSAVAWSESHDAQSRTMAADVTVERVE